MDPDEDEELFLSNDELRLAMESAVVELLRPTGYYRGKVTWDKETYDLERHIVVIEGHAFPQYHFKAELSLTELKTESKKRNPNDVPDVSSSETYQPG